MRNEGCGRGTDCVKIRTFVVGPFQANCYLVSDEATGEAVLIDPGDDADRLIAGVRKAGVTLKALYATHAHIDHVGAVEPVQKAFGVPFYLHCEEQYWLDRLGVQAGTFGLPMPPRPKTDGYVADGDRFTVGTVAFEVLHVPGHAPGHVAYVARAEKAAFVGDVLFAGSIGRTDFPGCSHRQLLDSICGKLFPLGDDVTCHCGHGPETTIGEERRTNPFLGEL
jgi:glyoxylase-like metal-dependent hydrolase (beta-lactamase superfamily II)